MCNIDSFTAAFGTVIFTLQTVGLVVSDSFATTLRLDLPATAGIVEFLQSGLNPDKQTPEKCFFPVSLAWKLLIEAVLQPVLITESASRVLYLLGRTTRPALLNLVIAVANNQFVCRISGVCLLHFGCHRNPMALPRPLMRPASPVQCAEGTRGPRSREVPGEEAEGPVG